MFLCHDLVAELDHEMLPAACASLKYWDADGVPARLRRRGTAHTLAAFSRHGINKRRRAMASSTAHPNHQLISSDDVNGTEVYDLKGKNIGSIDHLMIDKPSGRVTYAVMSFGGFHRARPQPLSHSVGALKYDTSLAASSPASPNSSSRMRLPSVTMRGRTATGRTAPTSTTTSRRIGCSRRSIATSRPWDPAVAPVLSARPARMARGTRELLRSRGLP